MKFYSICARSLSRTAGIHQRSVVASQFTGGAVSRTAGVTSKGMTSIFSHSSIKYRHYSVSSPLSQSLVDALTSEHEEETASGNAAMPDELVALKSVMEAHWRIVDDENSAMVQLFLKDKKVQISFHCQDTITPVDEEIEDDNDEEEPASPMRFTVTQTKAGKTLVINCISQYGELKIEGIATTKQDVDSIHAKQGTLDKTSYEGPEFLELDEGVQDKFYGFLESDLHITTDVTAFVAMYADYKEQEQYCKFLKDAKSIIS